METSFQETLKEALKADEDLIWAGYWESLGFEGEQKRMEIVCSEKWAAVEKMGGSRT